VWCRGALWRVQRFIGSGGEVSVRATTQPCSARAAERVSLPLQDDADGGMGANELILSGWATQADILLLIFCIQLSLS